MKEKESRKKARRPKVRQTVEKIGEVALSPSAFGAELAMCQRCGGRTAEKDAAGCSGERRQMGGGDSTKVEAAKRRRQNQKEEKRQNY